MHTTIINGNNLIGAMATFNIVVEKGEDGYLIAEVVELPGCRTQARTRDQLLSRIKDAIRLYLKCRQDDEPIVRFVGLERVDVRAS